MFVGCGCQCNKLGSESAPSLPTRSSLSGSVQSIGSSIANPGGPYPIVSCSACLAGVAPVAYQFAWNYDGESGIPSDPRPCCSAYRSFRTIKVIRRSVKKPDGSEDTAYCWYQSIEGARMSVKDFRQNLFIPTWSCVTEQPDLQVTSWPRLAELRINLEPSEDTAIPTVKIWFLNRFWFAVGNQARTFWHSANYTLVVPAGETWLKGPPLRWEVPCLRPLDFQLVNIQNPQNLDQDLGPGWQGTGFSALFGTWIGAPCRQVAFSGFDLALPRTITLFPVGA